MRAPIADARKDAAALKEAGKAIRAEIRRQDRAAKAGKKIDQGWHRKVEP